MATALPQQILASVWGLSDLDADGRLSCEEFILAMHLCDVARQVKKLLFKENFVKDFDKDFGCRLVDYLQNCLQI